MPSFQISLIPSQRAAGRFVASVRRTLQKALAEEQQRTGLSQSDLARAIGVHRSVINREFHGRKDMTLGRVAELAWAMGRKAIFDASMVTVPAGANIPALPPVVTGYSHDATFHVDIRGGAMTATPANSS